MSYDQLNNPSYQDEQDINRSHVGTPDNFGQNAETDRLLGFPCQTIEGPDENFEANGFQHSIVFSLLYHTFGIFTFGFVYLFAYWRPDWEVLWKRRKATLVVADTLLLKDVDGLQWVVNIKEEKIGDDCEQLPQDFVCCTLNSDTSHHGICTSCRGEQGNRHIRYFGFQYMKYIWNFRKMEFECLMGLGRNISIGSLMTDFRGYTPEIRELRHKVFGRNLITVEVKSYLKLLFSEVLNPFYIFQIASITLWTIDQYYLYAICIFFISCLSIGASLYETRKQSESLRSMVEASNTNTVFVRHSSDGVSTKEIDALDVVPGDIIVIPPNGCVMACDAVLISGNTIVNESMLTGESVPVTKTPVTFSEEMEIFSSEKHKRHTLFCGTTVIQTRYYGKAQVLAVVVRTGFSTAKGELVRSILYPRPIDFKFYKDSMKFIGFLFAIALFGMGYSLYLHITRAKPIVQTVIRTLDIVTIVVPPALPAAMTVGTYYAQSRLKKLGIFCISPPRINVSGKVKLFCFDKTGTLTEDGLDVWGVVGLVDDPRSHKKLLGEPSPHVDQLKPKSSLAVSLASCHSLTFVNGELIGDPLDLQMFKATKWSLLEPEHDSECFDNLIPTFVRPPLPVKSVLYSPSACNSSTVQPKSVENQNNSSKERDEVDSVLVSSKNENLCNYNDEISKFTLNGDSQKLINVEDLVLEQIFQVVSAGSANVREKTAVTVKPCGSQSFVKPASSIEETPFEVPFEVGIVRQFPFSSSTQRMSVIVRVLGSKHMELYAKGAPEVIQMLCRPETVPDNFSTVLNEFTVKGFRVIALANKALKKLSWHNAQKIKRDQIENNMSFLGLLILQNVLKPETTPVILQLKKANIRTVMVTGDNILTGICVAKDCGMADPNEKIFLAKVITEEDQRCLVFESAHSGGLSESMSVSQDKPFTVLEMEKSEGYRLAVTGSVWAQIKEYFPEYIPYIVSQGIVFGRMSPDQKVQLVEELMELQYVVGMCGDGANDCGALKAAHIGISLSEAEASVAAPFTSHTPNITCVPQVICEGRCALTTNFSVFKYMALYSIIQFISILILYNACTNLSDPQFLYIDLFIVTVIAIFMGYTKANHDLVAKRPLSNLIGAVNIFSVLSQIFWVMAVQIFAYYYLMLQPWYIPQSDCVDADSDDIVDTWETNVIFCVSSFQYLALALIYSPGLPFRKPFYTNTCLLMAIILLTSTTVWLSVYPTEPVAKFMGLKDFPADYPFVFRGMLLLFVVFHFIVGSIIEYYVAGSNIAKKVFQFLSCKHQPKNLYKRVAKKIEKDPAWPPMEGRPIYSSIT